MVAVRVPAYVKVIVLALVVGIGGSVFSWLTMPDWFPVNAATQATRQDQIYLVVMVICWCLFGTIFAGLVFSLLSWRAKPGDDRDGPAIHGHTGLEIVWTVIPVIIVVSLAVYAGVTVVRNEALTKRHLTVHVVGQQFWWSFHYPGHTFTAGYAEVPVNQDVQFRITAPDNDVVHEFYIPAFREGEDAVPGITTFLEAHPTRLGTYEIVCAELCGIGHAQMRTVIRVVTESQYQQWLAAMQSAVKPAASTSGSTTSSSMAGPPHASAALTLVPVGTEQ